MLEWKVTHYGKPVGTVFAEDHGEAKDLAEQYCIAQAIRFTRVGLRVTLVNCCGESCGECHACRTPPRRHLSWGLS